MATCEVADNADHVLLDGLLPDYQFHEVHSIAVNANGRQVFAALAAVTPTELPLFRLLMAVRSLPARTVGGRGGFGGGSDSLLEQAKRAGFVVLGEESGRELVLRTVGQPWRLVGGPGARVRTPADFGAFHLPGFAKIATNFRVEESASRQGTSRLSTETRVWVPDTATRLRFAAYWVLIRAGSGLIRREWLRRTRERAEAAS